MVFKYVHGNPIVAMFCKIEHLNDSFRRCEISQVVEGTNRLPEIGEGIDIQRRRLAPSPFTPEAIGFQGFNTVAPTDAVEDAFSL